MSVNLKFWDEEFAEKLKELSKLLGDTEKTRGSLKSTKLSESKEKLQHILKTVKRSYRHELRDLPGDERYTYSLRLEKYEKEIEILKQKIAAQDKSLLLGTDERNPEVLLDTATSRNVLLSETEKIQGKTQESLQQSLQKAREMNEIGTEALKNLESQGEQLDQVKAKIDQMESELKKAEALMKGLIKRMMTDKLIVGFIGLIFFTVVALIIYSQVRPSSNSGSTNS